MASTMDDGEARRGGEATTSASSGLPVRVLVEAAMLAAMTGLSFHISSLFRFDAYFGALFPLPVVIACARWGSAAARRTLVVATLLLLLISGPLRALNYFFLHARGRVGGSPCPASALTRTFGIVCSLSVSSLLYRENVMKLLVTQMYALLDQFAANVGATFAPDITWVWATAMVLILVNSLSYTLILHMVYTIVLNAVTRRNFANAPAKVCRALGVPF
ncbi:unnamed product [Ostreococcus tauri]|uniref:Unnamed product n=1 Tax=Ostreococcus tauri TaxID=70448 RepID=A0A090N372_OSTTA|nr:unnamed product [Ostreococcus tauri]CEF97613.1 unnamed product [Ostreococcus tauri]|eukprot:XP_022838787.1 unnamed product [Ostreococcus tauri]